MTFRRKRCPDCGRTFFSKAHRSMRCKSCRDKSTTAKRSAWALAGLDARHGY
jgi:ribosomal protein S27E